MHGSIVGIGRDIAHPNGRAGLGAGGMPTNPGPLAPSARQDIGHGRGVAFMLDKGLRADFAVITKTNWAVSWEEVGLSWFRIRIHGAMNYTGVRHFVNYDNPIVHAAKVIPELEEFFAEYAKRHTSGLVAPRPGSPPFSQSANALIAGVLRSWGEMGSW